MRVITRARVLRKSHRGRSDEALAEALDVAVCTVERIRKRYAAAGLRAAVYDAPRPDAAPVLDNTQEARLVAIACSTPPEAEGHGTMELLRRKLLADGVVKRVSIGTI